MLSSPLFAPISWNGAPFTMRPRPAVLFILRSQTPTFLQTAANPFLCHTSKKSPVTPIIATLPKTHSRKSFAFHTCDPLPRFALPFSSRPDPLLPSPHLGSPHPPQGACGDFSLQLSTSYSLPYILPSSVCLKSFVCHSYENCRGGGYSCHSGSPQGRYARGPRHSPLFPSRSFRVHGGADDPHLIRGRHDFKPAAPQRAHLHHFMHQPVQQSRINELGVRASDEKRARPLHVDAGGRGRCQCAVAQLHKFRAPGVSRARIFKYLFRLQIQKAHAHRSPPENSLQVPFASAAAETLFRVQRDHGVAPLPHAFACGIPPKPYAVSQRPHARELVQLPLRRRDARGHGVGVIENAHGNSGGFAFQRRGKRPLQREALHLLQVGRFLDDAVLDNSRKPDAHGCDFFHHQYANCPAHSVTAHLFQSEIAESVPLRSKRAEIFFFPWHVSPSSI